MRFDNFFFKSQNFFLFVSGSDHRSDHFFMCVFPKVLIIIMFTGRGGPKKRFLLFMCNMYFHIFRFLKLSNRVSHSRLSLLYIWESFERIKKRFKKCLNAVCFLTFPPLVLQNILGLVCKYCMVLVLRLIF